MADPKIRYDILANAEGEEDVRRLAAELEKLDDSIDPAGARRAQELAEELKQLSQQRQALEEFQRSLVDANEAGSKLETSTQQLNKLRQQLEGVAEPTRKQRGELERLTAQEEKAQQAYTRSNEALSTARSGLEKLGLSSSDLAGANQKLEQSFGRVRGEVAAVGNQGQAVQAYRELATATDKARGAYQAADQAVQDYAKQLQGLEEPTAQQSRKLQTLSEAARQAQLAYQGAAQEQAEAGKQLRAAGVDVGKLTTAQSKLAPAQQQVAQATKEASTALNSNAQALQGVQASSTGVVGALGDVKLQLAAAGAAALGLQQVLGAAAKVSSEFSAAIAEVNTLLDDTADVDALARSVEELTLQFGGKAADQARALYQIISAGATDSAQAVQLLEAANRLAIGGVTDVKTAADGLTTVLNAYGTSAGSAEQVSDALFVAMRAGKTTVSELSSSIGQVAPLAATAGVSLEQLLAGAAALTKGGVTTSQAMTQLRGVISGIVKPTADATKVAGELGIQFDAQSLKAKGLAAFLEEVRVKTGGNTDTMARLFGSVEALGGVLALTGNQAGDFASILQGMEQRAGATDDAFNKLKDTPAQVAARFAASLEQLQRSVGDAVTSFTPLLEGATKAVNLFNQLPEPVRTTTVAVGTLALSLPALGLALNGLRAGLTAVTGGLVAKAGAAASTVAPLRAAGTATAALGAAGAAAAPGVSAAAVATTGFAKALTALKVATGVGLVLTVAEVAMSFIRASNEAKNLREATAQALAAPADTSLVPAAEAAADALGKATSGANATARALKAQDAAARDAAKALGVDLFKAGNLVSDTFADQLDQLAKLIQGLGSLQQAGVNTGQVVQQALEKMIGAARNERELDALRLRIEALGKAGTISQQQVTGLLEAVQQQSKQASGAVDALGDAYKRLGVTSKAELDKVAADNRQAWELIKADASASLETKQQAFKRYAESAIKANGGVADSTLKAEATSLKLSIQADKTGQAIVSAMDKSTEATEKTKKKFNELGQEINDAGEAINQLAGGIGNSLLSRTQDLLGNASRAARNASINDSNSINARFNSSSGFLPVTGTGTITTPPPDNSGDWVWKPMLNLNAAGGEWVRSPAAQARDLALQQAQLGLVRDTRPGFEGQWVRATPAPPAPAAARPPAASPASSGGPPILGRFEVTINGVSAFADTRAQAEALLRELERSFGAQIGP